MYFITSNQAIKELENPFLRLLMDYSGIKLPSIKSFNQSILPNLNKKLVMGNIQ
jgi:hypothetical protein